MNEVEQLRKIIGESNNIVFFGGAGVSTESGIPDFRSVDGLYHQKYDYPPETILSHTFYRRKPEEFFRFYKDKMLCLSAKPNAAHRKLAEWEKEGKSLEYFSLLELVENHYFDYKAGYAKKTKLIIDGFYSLDAIKFVLDSVGYNGEYKIKTNESLGKATIIFYKSL